MAAGDNPRYVNVNMTTHLITAALSWNASLTETLPIGEDEKQFVCPPLPEDTDIATVVIGSLWFDGVIGDHPGA